MADIPDAFMAAVRDVPVAQLDEIIAAALARRKGELKSGQETILIRVVNDAMNAKAAGKATPGVLYDMNWLPLYGIASDLFHALWRVIYVATPDAPALTPALPVSVLPPPNPAPQPPEPTPIPFGGAKDTSAPEEWTLADVCHGLGMTVKDVESAIALGCLKASGRRNDRQVGERDVAKFFYCHPDQVMVKTDNGPILEKLATLTKYLHRRCDVCGSSAESAA